jgi:LmbE family N-acetylglucosaminyl deacetylase
VATVWIAGYEPNLVVDITDTFPAKIAALRSHVSQVGHREDLEEMMRGWASANAQAGVLGDGRLAETFRVVNTA